MAGPGRIGARTTGRPSVPPFEGVLNVVISSRSAEHLPELPQILSAFRRAWSTLAGRPATTASQAMARNLPTGTMTEATNTIPATP